MSTGKMIRTKFKCLQVTSTEFGDVVGLKAVDQHCEENKVFGDAPAAGEMNLRIEKDSGLADKFKAGEEFYLDFTPAPKTEAPKVTPTPPMNPVVDHEEQP